MVNKKSEEVKVVEPVASEEKSSLLEAYKKQNPEKYAAKLASGEFAKKNLK